MAYEFSQLEKQQMYAALNNRQLSNKVMEFLSVAGDTVAHDANGFTYGNSTYYADGNTHVGNADIVEDVEEGVPTSFKMSRVGSQNSTYIPEGMTNPYDLNTGLFTLNGFEKSDMLLFRFQIDIEPDSDESSAMLQLDAVTGSGRSIVIEEQFLSMSDGAGIDYVGIATIPVFVSSTFHDDGTGNPTVITPKIVLKNTGGIIKPRGHTLYIWR